MSRSQIYQKNQNLNCLQHLHCVAMFGFYPADKQDSTNCCNRTEEVQYSWLNLCFFQYTNCALCSEWTLPSLAHRGSQPSLAGSASWYGAAA